MYSDNAETVGKRIKSVRKLLGYTQEELAEMMCTTKSMISYYENDHGDMKQSMVSEFARVLNTSVEYLVCGIQKLPEKDAEVSEAVSLFSQMDAMTRKILLVQMRALAKI